MSNITTQVSRITTLTRHPRYRARLQCFASPSMNVPPTTPNLVNSPRDGDQLEWGFHALWGGQGGRGVGGVAPLPVVQQSVGLFHYQ